MRSRQRRIKDGEPWHITSGEPFRVICCDCALLHNMLAVARKDGSIEIIARRNNRATAQLRRRRK